MSKSAVTKKYTNLYRLFFALSLIVTLAPVLGFTVAGFVTGAIHAKVVLGITLAVAIILTIINLIFKFHIRSVIWILVLGIYFCIQNIMPLLLVVAISTILDEFLLTPLYKMYKDKAKINREIDKRIP